MKKIAFVFFLLNTFMISACNDVGTEVLEITEEEAKQIVIDHHAEENNNVEIVSVISKSDSDKYIILWENEPIKEGIDSVHKETGKLKVIESSHGTCKWL